MTKFGFVIFFLLLTACVSAPKPEVKTPEQAALDAKCKDCPPDHHLAVTIANGTTARFFLRASVNEQPKKFLLDTGAFRSQLIIDDDTKNLKAIGTSRVGGVSLTPQVCAWVKVDSFRLSGWHYSQAPFTRCEDTGMGNILGMDYLRHGVLALDFEYSSYSLKGAPPKQAKLKELKRNQFGMPEIPVKIMGETQMALFDTGCGMTVVDQAIVDAHPKAFQPFKVEVNGEEKQVESPFKDSTGKTVNGKAYMASEIEIEGVPKTAQLVTAIPFSKELKDKIHANIIIGANMMVVANWFFDFKTNQWAAYAFSPDTVKLSGVQITGDEVLRTDDKKITVNGNAKIANDDCWLTGPMITIDIKKKRAHCEKDCILAQAENRTYVSPIDVDISGTDWLKFDTEKGDAGINGAN